MDGINTYEPERRHRDRRHGTVQWEEMSEMFAQHEKRDAAAYAAIDEKLSRLVHAIEGDIATDKPGLVHRVRDLEATSRNQIKIAWTMATGVLAAAGTWIFETFKGGANG